MTDIADDFFGIGTALKSMYRLYFGTARMSGRTTRLVESLKSGDRVIVSDIRQGKYLERMCRERGVEIRWARIDPKAVDRLYSLGTSEGPTIFDHVWIEEYYQHQLNCASATLNEVEQRLSGYDWRHRKTRRAAAHAFLNGANF